MVIASQGSASVLARAVASAFVTPWISGGIYIIVALMWLIPDRQIERALGRTKTK